MGLRVIAVDVGESKLSFCSSLGADLCIDPRKSNEGKAGGVEGGREGGKEGGREGNGGSKSGVSSYVKEVIEKSGGGVHAALCFAPSTQACADAIQMTRRCGTCVLVALPKGSFQVDVPHVVLNRITIRGSIVGNRLDMTGGNIIALVLTNTNTHAHTHTHTNTHTHSHTHTHGTIYKRK